MMKKSKCLKRKGSESIYAFVLAIFGVVLSAIILASGKNVLLGKLKYDPQVIVESQCKKIYTLMLETASLPEQGYVIYPYLNGSYNLRLYDDKLILILKSGGEVYYYGIPFKKDFGGDITIHKANITEIGEKYKGMICIVKKYEDCKPQLYICPANDESCCSYGQPLC